MRHRLITSPAPDGATSDVEPDHRWVLRIWAVLGVLALVTAWRSHVVGIPVRDPGGAILVSRILITLGVFAGLVVVDAARRTPRPWSMRRVARVVRTRWPRRRLLLAAAGLLAYHLVYFCYHNLKSWDVFNASRDAMLTRVDQYLFLGHSPAVLLHDLLGVHPATHVLVFFYESFPTMVTVFFPAVVVFADRMRDGFVGLASLIWVWILGVGSYYLIPSLGPFDDRPQDFAGLPRTIVSETQTRYMDQRANLLAHPDASDAFAQVSAFASLHVGVTCVILLLLRHYGLNRAARVLTAYLAVTIVATIYLGWHFVVDDVAGIAIAVAAVWLGRRTIYPRGRTETSREASATPV